mmetsp:Transcript_36872/g.113869  ORF Transcript_36872/g.113869 Transcript_36872/m.113869 type:complete len:223 (-) Transcript_36872:1616-2284(-)
MQSSAGSVAPASNSLSMHPSTCVRTAARTSALSAPWAICRSAFCVSSISRTLRGAALWASMKPSAKSADAATRRKASVTSCDFAAAAAPSMRASADTARASSSHRAADRGESACIAFGKIFRSRISRAPAASPACRRSPTWRCSWSSAGVGVASSSASSTDIDGNAASSSSAAFSAPASVRMRASSASRTSSSCDRCGPSGCAAYTGRTAFLINDKAPCALP